MSWVEAVLVALLNAGYFNINASMHQCICQSISTVTCNCVPNFTEDGDFPTDMYF